MLAARARTRAASFAVSRCPAGARRRGSLTVSWAMLRSSRSSASKPLDGRLKIRTRRISTNSEPLLDETRAMALEAWGMPKEKLQRARYRHRHRVLAVEAPFT
jgi:hypothetical protein